MIKMFLAEQQKGDLVTENEKLISIQFFKESQETKKQSEFMQMEKAKIISNLT